MISDVLFEAVQEIERYEAECPESYGDIKEEIAAVKNSMRALQQKLDTPPDPLEGDKFFETMRKELPHITVTEFPGIVATEKKREEG